MNILFHSMASLPACLLVMQHKAQLAVLLKGHNTQTQESSSHGPVWPLHLRVKTGLILLF